jgi:hypothetical protein
MATKYTKWPYNIPKGHKIFQYLPFMVPPKYNRIGNFGMKMMKPSGKP